MVGFKHIQAIRPFPLICLARSSDPNTTRQWMLASDEVAIDRTNRKLTLNVPVNGSEPRSAAIGHRHRAHPFVTVVDVVDHPLSSPSSTTPIHRHGKSRPSGTVAAHVHPSTSSITVVKHRHPSPSSETAIHHHRGAHASQPSCTAIWHRRRGPASISVVDRPHPSPTSCTPINHAHQSQSSCTAIRHRRCAPASITVLDHLRPSPSLTTTIHDLRHQLPAIITVIHSHRSPPSCTAIRHRLREPPSDTIVIHPPLSQSSCTRIRCHRRAPCLSPGRSPEPMTKATAPARNKIVRELWRTLRTLSTKNFVVNAVLRQEQAASLRSSINVVFLPCVAQ